MSNTTKPNSDNEIDLAEIARRIGAGYQNFLTWVFSGILFLIKHIVVILLLLVLGVAAGFFLDGRSSVYENEIIVAPNFGTTDYLYSNVELLNSRIKEGDTIFLSRLGIKKAKSVAKIEVKPIVDIYNLVNKTTSERETYRNNQNFELVKLLSEGSDINKVIADEVTSRNYPEHILRVTTNETIRYDDVIGPLLAFLNNNTHYEKIRQEYVKNVKEKIVKNEEIIEQINGILNDFSKQSSGNQKSDKLVYYNENSQLNDIISTKNNLLIEIGRQKIELINFDKVIKEKGKVINIREKKGINNKMKFLLPLILVLLFILGTCFRSFYQAQMARRQTFQS